MKIPNDVSHAISEANEASLGKETQVSLNPDAGTPDEVLLQIFDSASSISNAQKGAKGFGEKVSPFDAAKAFGISQPVAGTPSVPEEPAAPPPEAQQRQPLKPEEPKPQEPAPSPASSTGAGNAPKKAPRGKRVDFRGFLWASHRSYELATSDSPDEQDVYTTSAALDKAYNAIPKESREKAVRGGSQSIDAMYAAAKKNLEKALGKAAQRESLRESAEGNYYAVVGDKSEWLTIQSKDGTSFLLRSSNPDGWWATKLISEYKEEPDANEPKRPSEPAAQEVPSQQVPNTGNTTNIPNRQQDEQTQKMIGWLDDMVAYANKFMQDPGKFSQEQAKMLYHNMWQAYREVWKNAKIHMARPDLRDTIALLFNTIQDYMGGPKMGSGLGGDTTSQPSQPATAPKQSRVPGTVFTQDSDSAVKTVQKAVQNDTVVSYKPKGWFRTAKRGPQGVADAERFMQGKSHIYVTKPIKVTQSGTWEYTVTASSPRGEETAIIEINPDNSAENITVRESKMKRDRVLEVFLGEAGMGAPPSPAGVNIQGPPAELPSSHIEIPPSAPKPTTDTTHTPPLPENGVEPSLLPAEPNAIPTKSPKYPRRVVVTQNGGWWVLSWQNWLQFLVQGSSGAKWNLGDWGARTPGDRPADVRQFLSHDVELPRYWSTDKTTNVYNVQGWAPERFKQELSYMQALDISDMSLIEPKPSDDEVSLS